MTIRKQKVSLWKNVLFKMLFMLHRKSKTFSSIGFCWLCVAFSFTTFNYWKCALVDCNSDYCKCRSREGKSFSTKTFDPARHKVFPPARDTLIRDNKKITLSRSLCFFLAHSVINLNSHNCKTKLNSLSSLWNCLHNNQTFSHYRYEIKNFSNKFSFQLFSLTFPSLPLSPA